MIATQNRLNISNLFKFCDKKLIVQQKTKLPKIHYYHFFKKTVVPHILDNQCYTSWELVVEIPI